MKRFINFLVILVRSAVDPRFYPEILEKRWSFTIVYLIIFITFIISILTVKYTLALGPMISDKLTVFAQKAREIMPEDIEIKIRAGELSVNQHEPVRIKNIFAQGSGNPAYILVIDTDRPTDDILNYSTYAFANRRRLAYLDGTGFRSESLSGIFDLTINRRVTDAILYYLSPNIRYATPILAGILFITFFVSVPVTLFIQIFLYSFVTVVVGKIATLPLSYKKYFQVTIHAATIPVLIETTELLIDMPIPIPMLPVFAYILLVVLAIRALRRRFELTSQLQTWWLLFGIVFFGLLVFIRYGIWAFFTYQMWQNQKQTKQEEALLYSTLANIAPEITGLILSDVNSTKSLNLTAADTLTHEPRSYRKGFELCLATSDQFIQITTIIVNESLTWPCTSARNEYDQTGLKSFGMSQLNYLSSEEYALVEEFRSSQKSGDQSETETLARKLIDLHPSTQNYYEIGLYYYDLAIAREPHSTQRRELIQQAQDYFQKAIDKDPDFAPAASSLALAIHLSNEKSRTDEIDTLLSKAKLSDPSFGLAFVNRALVLADRGNKAEAYVEAKTSVTVNPKDPNLEYIKSVYVCISRWAGIKEPAEFDTQYGIDREMEIPECNSSRKTE